MSQQTQLWSTVSLYSSLYVSDLLFLLQNFDYSKVTVLEGTFCHHTTTCFHYVLVVPAADCRLSSSANGHPTQSLPANT
jgi:hypothetical protein